MGRPSFAVEKSKVISQSVAVCVPAGILLHRMLISIVVLAVLQLVVVGTAEGRRKSNRRTTSVAPRTSTDPNEGPEIATEIGTQLDVDSAIFATEVPGNETFREQAGIIFQGEPAESDDPGVPSLRSVTCNRPPPVEGAKIPRARDKQYAIGSIVSYQCDYGYVSDGSTIFQSTCEFDEESGQAKWSDPNLNCFPRSCGDPGFVTNARRIGSVFTFPYTVEFECDEGYQLTGTGVRYCQASGVWSGKLPSCEPIYCDRPHNPENGKVRFISLEYGAELRYECNKGFILSNKQQRVCTANGTWSNDDPVCIESSCDEPQAPSHGFMQLTNGQRVGSLAFYTCEEDKSLIGASTSKCLEDGQWTFPPPKCADQCEVPTVINGMIGKYEIKIGRYRDSKEFVSLRRGRKVISGETMILRCNENFASEEVPGATELQISCEDGNWSPSVKCVSVLCQEDPPAIENGYPVVHKRTHGHVIYYKCNPNYSKGSTGNVECFHGKWRGPTPTCIDGRCNTDHLNIPGLVKPGEESIANHEYLEISCEEGYQLTGRKRRIYCNEGKWDINYNPCIKDEVPSNPKFTNMSPLSTSTTEISRITTRSTSAPEKRPQNATPDSLIVGSEDLQKPDDCFCICAVPDRNVLADVKDKELLPGRRLKKGDTATFSCEVTSRILFWPNGLRVRGSVDLTCNTCERWDERDIPRCVPFYAGDTWIVFNPKMKLLPRGIVQIREREDVRIECSTLDNQQRRMHYPQWRSSTPKYVSVTHHNGHFGYGTKLSAYLDIQDFKSELSGRYECYATDYAGAQYGSTILNLEVSDNNQCPEIDEGNFIINYSNDKKTNSVAHYYCKSISQKIKGSNTRTCQPNGEWSGSDPVCVDITCRKFWVSGSLNVSYSMGNKVGSIAEFRCKEPSVLIGSSTAKCLFDGTWDNPQPSCDEPEILCPVIDEQGIFMIRYDNYRKANSNAYYYCKEPDQKISGSNVRNCRENGEWAGVDPECVAPGCSIHDLMESLISPIVPNEEDITGEIILPGTEIRLLCENKMVLIGNKKVTCNQQGRWIIGNVQCKLGCHLDVNDSPTALIIEPMKDYYRLGEGALLSCPEGYELTTQVERVMCIGSSWSDPLPSCKEK